jgi:hypothetical protein
MEFGLHDDPMFPQTNKIDFSEDESTVISSAFREEVNNKIRTGHWEAVTEFEARVAGWPEEYEGCVYANTPCHIMSILSKFISNTEQEVNEIVDNPLTSSFRLRDAAQRIKLMHHARKLTEDFVQITQGQTADNDQIIQSQQPKPQK